MKSALALTLQKHFGIPLHAYIFLLSQFEFILHTFIMYIHVHLVMLINKLPVYLNSVMRRGHKEFPNLVSEVSLAGHRR